MNIDFDGTKKINGTYACKTCISSFRTCGKFHMHIHELEVYFSNLWVIHYQNELELSLWKWFKAKNTECSLLSLMNIFFHQHHMNRVRHLDPDTYIHCNNLYQHLLCNNHPHPNCNVQYCFHHHKIHHIDNPVKHLGSI